MKISWMNSHIVIIIMVSPLQKTTEVYIDCDTIATLRKYNFFAQAKYHVDRWRAIVAD